MNIPLSPCVPENLISRDGFSRPVPRQPAHLHTQPESGAYLRDSFRVPRRRPYETAIRHRVSPEFIGSRSCVPMAFTAESPPDMANKPQGSSERVLPWQITMDQLIFASLSHTHYWYEVGMLKVPALVTLGQQYNIGEEPTVILYTYINRHAGTRNKKQIKKQCSTSSTSRTYC